MGYPYSSLDADTSQIRTLTINPSGAHDSKLQCSLNTISLLSDKGPYEALSYVWGTSTSTITIYIDEHPFPVTRNLGTALRYLRKPHESRTLWIDAVCINQDDIQERNVQVRQMGQIYSQASRVLIWLGAHDAELESTMSKLQDPDILKNKLYDEFPADVERGLQKMLSKPWWHRVWCIQELILANADPLVGCGHTWLEWEKVYRAVLDYTTTLIDGKEGIIRDRESDSLGWAATSWDINRHMLLRTQWKERENLDRKRPTASEMVERTRGYQCTDKRDQIYGVRDLICEEEKTFYPSPDYEKSVSKVYQEAMLALFKSKNNLTFLVHAVQGGLDRDHTLPTWVADFSQRQWDSGLYGNINPYQGEDEEGDGEGKKAKALFFSHDPIAASLRVRGSFLGNAILSRRFIQRVALDMRDVVAVAAFEDDVGLLPRDETGRLWGFIEFVKEILRMSAIACKVWTGRFGRQKAKEKLAHGDVWSIAFGGHILFTFVDAACVRAGMEQISGDDRPREYWNVEAFVRESCPWYADALKGMNLFHPGRDLSNSARLRQALWESLVIVMQMSHEGWWSVTDSGYIFRANREVKANDVLCEITGCQQPMVLRKRGEGDHELLCLATSDDFHSDHYRSHREETADEELTLK